MPTTREMITQIQLEAKGWNRDGVRGVLYHFREAHRYMMSQDSEQNIIIDDNTGRPPGFSTTLNKFSYTVGSGQDIDVGVEVRRIAGILVDAYVTNNKTSQFFYTFYNRFNAYPWSTEEIFVQGHPYWNIPVRQVDRRPGKPVRFSTVYNPADTSGINPNFLLYAYKLPTEIVSEQVEPDVPEQYHDLLVEGALARIERKQYGKKDAYEFWTRKVNDEYNTEMNRGAQHTLHFVPPRYE